MFGASSYGVRRRPIGRYQARAPLDVAWRLTWPFLVSTIVAFLMILCTLLIGALEVASLAKSTNSIYGNTASTGAGIWCSVFFAIAIVLILMINYMRRVRLWATIALIATIVAACFAVILLGLDAKAVQDGTGWIGGTPDKTKILSAQLAFTILELLLCFVFIGIYIDVLIMAPRRLRRRAPVRFR